MDLKRKINLFKYLDDEQKQILEDKFLISLTLVTEEELKEILNFLEENNIFITKAREVKVVANSKEEIIKKYNILVELGEVSIYIKDVLKINRNVIDIYRKIQYCKQIGKQYKTSDGIYHSFLFNEEEWNKEINKENELTLESSTPLIEENITLESTIEPEVDNIVSFNDYVEPVVNDSVYNDPIENDFEKTIRLELDGALTDDLIHQDVTKFKDELEEQTEAQIINFQQAKSELEELKSQLAEISFYDIEPETYGMGRVA